MDKVYIVTSGKYSDYSIDAVFSTLDKAKEYENYSMDDSRVETFVLDGEVKPLIVVDITMDRAGDVKKIEKIEESARIYDGYVKYLNYYKEKNDFYLVFSVETESIERAIKVTNEKRAEILVANAWGDLDATRKLLMRV